MKLLFHILIRLNVLLLISSSALIANPLEENTCPEETECEVLMTTVIYVKQGALTSGDGNSWSSAYTFLQDALHDPRADTSSSSDPVEIWVAEGSYFADLDEGGNVVKDDQNASFELKGNILIYGGFEGDELLRTERDWAIHETILDGDIDYNSSFLGNSNSVVTISSDVEATLDGIIIQGGFQSASANGGGIFAENANLTLFNCTFKNNKALLYGGAIYAFDCELVIDNCSFLQNSTELLLSGAVLIFSGAKNTTITASSFSENSGGAIELIGGQLALFDRCVFYKNTPNTYGGIVQLSSSNVHIYNSLFYENITSNNNGTLRFKDFSGNSEVQMQLYNNTIVDNVSTDGTTSGITFDLTASTLDVINNLLWNNTGDEISGTGTSIVSHCLIDGGYIPGTDIVNSDPMFINPLNNDYRLMASSPAIETGNQLIYVGSEDLLGNIRKYGCLDSLIDIGAYEFQYSCQTTFYVDIDKSSGGDGTSWATAHKYLQDALQSPAAQYGGIEIWVAEGTYYPDEGSGQTDNERAHSFAMPDDVKIYGGFNGTETDLSDRDWNLHPTILSGDIDQVSGLKGNSYHVINNADISSDAVLDGFTIRDGSATGERDPSGAGMYNDNSDPTIVNCIFRDNTATINGAGIYNINASAPSISNSTFITNVTNDRFLGGKGGAICDKGSSSNSTNCTFYNNSSTDKSSAVWYGLNNSNSEITNSIIWGNNSEIDQSSGSTITVNNSIVERGYSGTNNIDEDPEFVDPAKFDLSLQSCSPAIDKEGTTSDTIDLAGNPRIHNATGSATATLDMGAYEFQGIFTAQCSNCEDMLVLTGAIGDGTYEASTSITCSDATMSGAINVTLSAPDHIKVDQGDELSVADGVTMQVTLDGCSN